MSEETSSTPGPWLYGKINEPRNVRLKRKHWEVAGGKGLKGVAIVFRSDANARLIAAAPELLEACRKAMCAIIGYKTTHDLHEDSVLNKALIATREAITKAEGRA